MSELTPSARPLVAPRQRWALKAQHVLAEEALVQGRPLADLIRLLLGQRGIVNETAVTDFLFPRLAALGDPFELPEMEAAVGRILKAVDSREHVILYGDYDVDGVTSMAVLNLALKAYGLDPKLFLPHRMEEGYGVSHDGIARAFEAHGKPGLFLALDCGTTSLSEMAALRGAGVDVVIIDHHELSPQGRPDCEALVNPKLGDDYHYFCTVGLVFKVVHALLKRRALPDFDLKQMLDLVALGTVADLVPIVNDNRILVRRGLELIAQTPRPGLQALKKVAGVDGLVQTQHLGFRIGPRLNAAGRLDTAATSLQVLLAETHEEAADGADLLDLHNRERQAVEQRVLKEAEQQLLELEDIESLSAIVLGSRQWHPGVVGIVASRISRMFHRPTILIAVDEEGVGKGSGRSIPGVSLVEAIEPCRDLLRAGGGHAMAIGLSVLEENIANFRERFGEVVAAAIADQELSPTLEIDAELRLKDMTVDFLNQFVLLEPFGMANPEPVFLCRGVMPRLPGRVMKERHLRVTLMQDGIHQDAIYFNAPLDNLPPPPWNVALRLQRNFFRGNESWQFTIEGIRGVDETIAHL
ncbi:MAG: single-stranded-DNA-specific exonuclease RecJ [Verrucomicrobiaceae bacterium]|nr:single-stranded-DNA-specific exonuclease RecJ [Verrucomicrobiaceae bacterium]